MVGLKRNLLRSGEENHLKYAPVRASNSKKSSKIKSHHISGFWGKKKKKERKGRNILINSVLSLWGQRMRTKVFPIYTEVQEKHINRVINMIRRQCDTSILHAVNKENSTQMCHSYPNTFSELQCYPWLQVKGRPQYWHPVLFQIFANHSLTRQWQRMGFDGFRSNILSHRVIVALYAKSKV